MWFSGPEAVGRKLREATLLPGSGARTWSWCEELEAEEEGAVGLGLGETEGVWQIMA